MNVESEDLSKLLSSAALVFTGAAISSVASLVERTIVGRLLSPDAYGEFSIGLAVFTLGATIGAAGFKQGVPRFMARFDTIEDIRGAWLTGACISIVLSIFIAVILFLGSPIIVPRLFETEEALWLYYALVLTIPIYVGFWIGVAAIRGMENTRYKTLTEDLSYPFLRVGLIVLLLSMGIGLVGAGIAYFTAVVITTVLTYVLLNRLFPLLGSFRFHGREMTTFSLPLIVSTIMSILLTRTDTLMVGYFRSSYEVGIYNAAYPLAGVLTVVLNAFGYMYLPIASRLDNEQASSVERVYETTTKWVYLLVFPAFVTLLVFSDEIVSIVFGGEYIAGGTALAILSVGFFTNAAVGRNRETLSALGATRFILISNVIAFALNIVLNLILIPNYGFMGAAIASAVSYIGLNFVVYTFLRVQFEITPFNRTSIRTFIALPVVLIPVGYLSRTVLPGDVFVVLLFGTVMGILSVLVVILVQGLEPEDVVLVDFIEKTIGIRIPFIRNYIPERSRD